MLAIFFIDFISNPLSNLIEITGLSTTFSIVFAITGCGLGYMILDVYEYLNVTVVYAGIVILAVIFFTIEKTIIHEVEKKTINKYVCMGGG